MARTISSGGDLGIQEITTLELPCDLSKKQLIQQAQLDQIAPIAYEFLTSEQFRISNQDNDRIVILDFALAPSTDMAVHLLSKGGYLPPTEEDALRLASCAMSFSKPIVFLHLDNLWRVPGSREQVCVLDLKERRRLYTIWYNNNWGTRYLFAARVPAATPSP